MYKRYWLVTIDMNGFEAKFLLYGTEQELWSYLNSEIGGGDENHTGNYKYSGASDKDVEAAKMLGIKAYIAPEL